MNTTCQHNQLSTTYDMAALCAALAGCQMRMGSGLGASRNVTVSSRIDYYARDFTDRARYDAKAFIAEFLPCGGLHTKIGDMDISDLDARLESASRQANRLRHAMLADRQDCRMKRTFAAYA